MRAAIVLIGVAIAALCSWGCASLARRHWLPARTAVGPGLSPYAGSSSRRGTNAAGTARTPGGQLDSEEATMRRWQCVRQLGLIALLGGISVGCGTTSLAAPERGVVDVVAANYRFQPDTIYLKAGIPTRLVLENRDPVKHVITFRGMDPQVLVAAPEEGKQAIVFTPTRTGTYYMYCSQPGHEQLGMYGTAVVVQ
jgi:plastocyanin